MHKFLTFTILIVIAFSCKKDKPKPSAERFITSFIFTTTLNPGLSNDIRGVIKNDSILLAVPPTVPLTGLTPSITYKGISVSPASAKPLDFTQPVIYTVTAEDNSTRGYIVVVRWQSTEKSISYFAFKAQENTIFITSDATGVINGDTINVDIDATSVTNLIPDIIHNGKTLTPSIGSSNNFVNPVEYTVTAEDGSTKKYVVIVHTHYSLFVKNRDGYLYAFDALTGKVKWKYKTESATTPSPAYAAGVVYINAKNSLHALDASTGLLKWQTNLLGAAASSPQVVNNVVYTVSTRSGSTASVSGVITAVDAFSGSIKWQQFFSANLVSGNPTVAEGMVLVCNNYSGLYCFDAETGAERWFFYAGIVRDNPVVKNGIVYIGGASYSIVAVDATTGLRKWYVPSSLENNLTNHGIGTSPTYADGIVYTASDSLYAYDAITGTVKWQTSVGFYGVVNPVVANGHIFATQQAGTVYAFNLDGTLKWRYGMDAPANDFQGMPSATVANGLVFSGRGINNKLFALDAGNGQPVWIYEGDDIFLSGPCVVDPSGNAFYPSVCGAQN